MRLIYDGAMTAAIVRGDRRGREAAMAGAWRPGACESSSMPAAARIGAPVGEITDVPTG